MVTINVVADSWHIEDDGKILAEIKATPLRYSWAITVHKSQGMTLDRAEMDLSRSLIRYGLCCPVTCAYTFWSAPIGHEW